MTGVGQIAKGTQKATKAVVSGTQNILAGGKASRMEGFRGKPTGGNLAKTRATLTGKPVAEVEGKARLDVAKRKSRMEGYQADKAAKDKPSFAKKHPLLTAGGLYLGARAAMGGGDENKQQAQQPQVIPGQY